MAYNRKHFSLGNGWDPFSLRLINNSILKSLKGLPFQRHPAANLFVNWRIIVQTERSLQQFLAECGLHYSGSLNAGHPNYQACPRQENEN